MEFGTLKIKLSFIVLTCNLNTAEDTGKHGGDFKSLIINKRLCDAP